jgi:protein BCP1
MWKIHQHPSTDCSAHAPVASERNSRGHKTNKPWGKHYCYLLIGKTFMEAGKPNSKNRWIIQKKAILMFANAQEEFFYEKEILKFSYKVQEENDTCLGARWSWDDVPMKPL